jgi:hypothetical protein
MFASLAAFTSIGLLAAVALSHADAKPRVFNRAPLPESTSDCAIVGLRAWHAIDLSRTLVLQSWHKRHALWPHGRELTAEPASLGIHAFKSAAALLAYLGPDIAGENTVVGTVALWGGVIEHESGWTAEKAYPAKIYAVNPDLAAFVRRVYGCETAAAPDGLAAAAERLESELRERRPVSAG